ncbi:MAG: hypothetical protein LBU35_02045 [Holosporales bacterium]|jgi:hypothetical protein|nr:hypothetical protein [Holosporales bacterium]
MYLEIHPNGDYSICPRKRQAFRTRSISGGVVKGCKEEKRRAKDNKGYGQDPAKLKKKQKIGTKENMENSRLLL